MGDLVRHAAEQEALGAGHALVADHDQVGVGLLGDVEDRVGRVALARRGSSTSTPSCLAGPAAASSVTLTSSRGADARGRRRRGSPAPPRCSRCWGTGSKALTRSRLRARSASPARSPGARPRRPCRSRRCQPRCDSNRRPPSRSWCGRILSRRSARARRMPSGYSSLIVAITIEAIRQATRMAMLI